MHNFNANTLTKNIELGNLRLIIIHRKQEEIKENSS